MMASHEELPGTQIEQLRVEDPGVTGYHPGEVIGYRCPLCSQCDESREQIYHKESCSLAGEHGRQYYDEEEMSTVAEGRSKALDPEHKIIMVRSCETDVSKDVARGNPIMFVCATCWNGDETLDELKHDESCPLACETGK